MSVEIEKELEKQFGKGIFSSGDKLIEKELEVISVSPALDIILGGGIPKGAFVTVSGPPKVGKSLLALGFAKNAQKHGMKVYYFDIEGRLKPRDLAGVEGLNTDDEHFRHIGSNDGTILYAEQYLEILITLVSSQRDSLFIFDSFSQLCSQAREANKGKRFRDDTSLMLADMTKRISNILPVTNNILIGTVHLIANQNPQSRSMWTESGGNKIKYQADVRLKAPYKEMYIVGDVPIGQIVHWDCECTALNAPPNQKAKSLLRYGYGIDEEYELLNILIDIGLVEKKGSWIIFNEETKLQGMEKARNFLVENPKEFDKLKKQLKETIGM